MFGHREPLTAARASLIQIPALAAEVRSVRLCEVSAAVTLLEQRRRQPELRESPLLAYA